MNICLVEIKNEYTMHLIKLLTPSIFEGIQSIYNKAVELSETNILKDFQILLESIPSWNRRTIDNETNRIILSTKPYLKDLVKATIKANIILLMYNPLVENSNINPALYEHININDFIHILYIECARELYNNPYLFYHKFKPLEIKRNQRDIIQLIKESIQNAIRKILPIQSILNTYLSSKNQKIDANITQEEELSMQELIKYNFNQPHQSGKQYNENREKFIQNIQDNAMKDNAMKDNAMKDNAMKNNAMKDNVNNISTPEIVKSDNLLDKIEKKLNTDKSNTSTNKSSSDSEKSSIMHKYNKDARPLEEKLKDVLHNFGDTDNDTSLNYTHDNEYQEVYNNNQHTNYARV